MKMPVSTERVCNSVNQGMNGSCHQLEGRERGTQAFQRQVWQCLLCYGHSTLK